MVKRVNVTEAQMEQAYNNWVDFHYGWDCEEAITRFFRWLDPIGIDHEAIDPWSERGTLKLLPKTAQRLNMLSGPHHVAFIKIYYINHPWK